jgi:hypothetical protein
VIIGPFMPRLLAYGLVSWVVCGAAMRAGHAQAATRSPNELALERPTAASFLERARVGTKRYRSQDAAVADGYKPVGVEFPAMGKHWVHLGHVLEDSLIPERPSVLIYVTVGGEPRLAGVAYTDLLHPGDALPTFPTGGWHEHNGTVDEESLPVMHGGPESTSGHGTTKQETRLAVLHAWLWTPNPAGMFVTDNWALPSMRLGVALPAATPRSALQALALAADEDNYLLLTLRTALDLTEPEELAAGRVLESGRADAAREEAAVRKARRLAPEAAARLDVIWSRTWIALERVLPSRVASLRALRRQLD